MHLSSFQIRKRFLDFFEKRNHVIIPSAPLVPQSDGTDRNVTLFNVAGMQPLMPYLLGQEHPQGKRLVNSQKCLRTIDIDEVGDNTHATFFEMLGNWSLGDYFKHDAISWSYLFLTDPDEGLGLDPKRIYVTVFAGNETVERDDESKKIWMDIGVPEHRIYYRDSKDNWWTAGPDSPAGPSTEMFYDMTGNLGDMTHEQFEAADERQDLVEIWNDVFMSYKQHNGQVVESLPNKNVDTGAGLERITAVVQGKKSIFETDLFAPIINYIKIFTSQLIFSEDYESDIRIIADHIKASVFLINEGVVPAANSDRGSVLYKLIKRALTSFKYIANDLALAEEVFENLVDIVITIYKYQEGDFDREKIKKILSDEVHTLLPDLINSEEKIRKVLNNALTQMEKSPGRANDYIMSEPRKYSVANRSISGEEMFYLFSTHGVPKRDLIAFLQKDGYAPDLETFHKLFEEHKQKSRPDSQAKFKGGLADAGNPAVVKLHTAHHLLLAALQEVLGPEVKQRGSNINAERLRIDFAFDRKLTNEECQRVEDIVNEKITAGLDVVKREMPRDEAEKIGAEMEFGIKYPDIVSVYFIGPSTDARDDTEKPFSVEFCGGPHVTNTRELGTFTIKKQESSSAGIRRIKAVLT